MFYDEYAANIITTSILYKQYYLHLYWNLPVTIL